MGVSFFRGEEDFVLCALLDWWNEGGHMDQDMERGKQGLYLEDAGSKCFGRAEEKMGNTENVDAEPRTSL